MKIVFAWWHILIIILPILPNLWSILNIWKHSFKDYNKKIIWLVIAVFLPLLGGLLYIFIGRRQALPHKVEGGINQSYVHRQNPY